MKTRMSQEPAGSNSRTFTLQDIEQDMRHAHDVRADEIAAMASAFTVKAKDLMGAVRSVWTAGAGLDARFNRA